MPDVVWCPNVPLLKSIDGGKTFQRVKGTHHGDHHDIWIDPKNPEADDRHQRRRRRHHHRRRRDLVPPRRCRSASSTTSASTTACPTASWARCRTWARRRARATACRGGHPLSDWHSVGGGEAGFAVPIPSIPTSSTPANTAATSRATTTARGRRATSASIPNPSGKGGEDLKYRFQWTAPILFAARTPDRLPRRQRAVPHQRRRQDLGQGSAPT